MINNIFPILTNPGYISGYTFRFTEADHGIPNYNFDISLGDVVQAGPSGWTSNLAVSQGPDYPSTIESLGAIKFTSNDNSLILGTDGGLQFPNGSIQTTAFEGGIPPIEIEYAELRTSITDSLLVPGAYYKITDFRTCYDQPDFNWVGNAITAGNYKQAAIEPIMVFATSESTISIDAYQPTYPNDKIQYDWTYGSTEVTNEAAYGRITERIDEFNNRTDYDHRTILFKRYDNYYYKENNINKGTIELIENTGEVIGTETIFSNYSVGDYIAIPSTNVTFFEIVSISGDTSMVVSGLTIPPVSAGANFYSAQRSGLTYKQNNISIDYTEHHTFLFENETIISNYIGDVASFIEWGENTFLLGNNVFGEDVIGNRIGNDFRNNTFNSDVEHNVIEDQFENNTIYNDEDFTDNQIGANFRNNLIICEGFNDNVIGDNCNNNKIFNNNNIADNQIGVGFNNNTIYSNFGDNKIGNGFSYNVIDGEFNNNSIGNQFNNNDTYQDFNDNSIGHYFDNNTIYSNFYKNEILNNFNDNLIGDSGNLDNFEFYRNRIGNDFYENTIRQDLQNNQIGNQFNNNTLNGNFYKNVIGNGFNNNGSIGYNFYGNQIGNGFNNNELIGDYFQDNQIGEYFESNSISYFFKDNKIGNQFENNTLGNTDYFNWDNTSIENLTGRTYNTFYNSLYGNEGENIGNVILGKELIMHDSVNNEYHKVKFTQWTQNGNGGGFSYERTKVWPSSGSTVYFTKKNYEDIVDVIVEGSLEIARNDNGGAIYNIADENNWNSNQSPIGTEWNSIYTQDDNGSLFLNNTIAGEFKGNLIVNEFIGNDVSPFIGSNEFLGPVYGNQIGSSTYYNDFLGSVNGNKWMGPFGSNEIGLGFSNNAFGNNVIGNNLANDFQNNEIGNEFNNNTIGDGFGFGNDDTQGNKIGNNFHDNTIQEYFYNNYISDNFHDNIIGNYFQWNVVNTNVDTIDFTTNYGNITGISYSAGGTSAADNIYNSLTGTVSGGSTGGIGAGADFTVTVTGGTVSSVLLNLPGKQYTTNDMVTILGTAIGGVTGVVRGFTSDGIGKTGSDGIYPNISAGGTGGENASFDITVASGAVSNIQLNSGGGGYKVNYQLVIQGNQFGGTDGSDNITITITTIYSDDIVIGVTGINANPSVYEPYTCQLFERQGGTKRLSFYDENDTLTITNINE